MQHEGYKIVTLNVNGLHNPIKRNKTIRKMKREKQDIISLQETDHKEVTLLNVYRPPGYDKQLIKKIFNLISEEASGVLICGGDWNVCLNPSLDSTNQTKKMQPEALYIRKLLKEKGMIDIRKEVYPYEK